MKALLLPFLCFISSLTAQPSKPPKLVVGIVVDQMRYDFLYRYYDKYGTNGFKKLMQKGLNCKNVHYNYFPTFTGPGHASIYTGTTPSSHGIVANDWFENNENRYVTQDDSVYSVGVTNKAGKMSPQQMKTTTITDQLRLATNQKSKVFGVALKDRGAILPAGHMANGAYWFDAKTGYWITSSFYQNQLPQWATHFNANGRVNEFVNQTWHTLLPIEHYTESTGDNKAYEKPFMDTKVTFPYDLHQIYEKDKSYEIIRRSPFGNTLTREFAQKLLIEEELGTDDVTDFLCISFSSTDYVGHQFGPNSIEVEDTYLRLDQDLAELLKTLDQKVGSNNYTLFLTADHGVMENPQFLQECRIPAGLFDYHAMVDTLELYLDQTLPTHLKSKSKWIQKETNHQLYLNDNRPEIHQACIDFISNYKGVKAVYSTLIASHHVSLNPFLSNGIYKRRTGDVFIVLEPGWFEDHKGVLCTTHGSTNEHDTHVPLLFYGKNIPKAETYEPLEITDIAPSLAQFLNILAPNGTTGKLIQSLFKK